MKTETTKVKLVRREDRQVKVETDTDKAKARGPGKLPKGLGLWVYAPLMP